MKCYKKSIEGLDNVRPPDRICSNNVFLYAWCNRRICVVESQDGHQATEQLQHGQCFPPSWDPRKTSTMSGEHHQRWGWNDDAILQCCCSYVASHSPLGQPCSKQIWETSALRVVGLSVYDRCSCPQNNLGQHRYRYCCNCFGFFVLCSQKAVMRIVTDRGGCDDDSDRSWWLWWW